jgi:polyadenylate-binding protein
MYELNYAKINDIPIRVMLADSDTQSLLRSDQGKLFLNNLDPILEDSEIHYSFASLGEVISCKIKRDEQGNSRGYGYVQFRSAENAEKAMKYLENSLVNGRIIQIQHFCRPKPRILEKSVTKAIPPRISTDVTEFWPVTSDNLYLDPNCDSRHCDPCNMADNEMTVSSAINRPEREAIIAEETECWRRQTADKYKGRNLYVRNFDEDMTDRELRELFSHFGELESVKIARNKDGTSMKFGYVCFKDFVSAQRAIQESVLLKVKRRTLYVSEFVSRSDRKRVNPAHTGIERVKAMILERFGSRTHLFKKLARLSDDQIKKLASNQELLTQWFSKA